MTQHFLPRPTLLTALATIVLSVVFCSCTEIKINRHSSHSSSSNTAELTTQKRHTQPFHKVEIRGVGNVVYTQDTLFSLRLEAPKNVLQQIETKFDNERLVIRTKEHHNTITLDHNDNVTIYIASPDLTEVEIRGIGSFRANKPIDSDTLTVTLRGVGSVKLNQVICDEFNATVRGTGTLDVKQLTAQQSYIGMKGTGTANVGFHNSDSACADLSGIGAINLTGSIRQLEKQSHGLGTINTKGLRKISEK